jgi:hypothetical protein
MCCLSFLFSSSRNAEVDQENDETIEVMDTDSDDADSDTDGEQDSESDQDSDVQIISDSDGPRSPTPYSVDSGYDGLLEVHEE